MAELFRFIEQAFVVPAGEDGAIDVATDSDFQNGLRAAIHAGEEPAAIRERAAQFLTRAANPQQGTANGHFAQYVQLGSRLRALDAPTSALVGQEVSAVFNQNPDALVGSDGFGRDLTLSSDLTVAVKLTTGFDRIDATTVATTRRVIAFLQEFVAQPLDPLDAETVSARLSRPLKMPQEYLIKPAAAPDVRPPVQPPDPAVERRQRLVREQAALAGAYDTLMRLHPSQLEVRRFDGADPPSGPPSLPGAAGIDRRAIAADGSGHEAVATASRTILAVPRSRLEALDRTVREILHAELPDPASASLENLVGVVKRRWLDVSNEVEPAGLPTPARTYRVGLHLFAVQDPNGLADMPVQALEAPGPQPDFGYAVTRPVGIGNLQVVRQELVGYVPADISHIESVLPGELMRRTTRREETSELTVTEESTSTQSEERDLQSTERNELASEAQKEASQQSVTTQGETSTTNYGRLVENSKTNYARSVTERAVNKVTQTVRQQRVQREKKVYVDKAVHEFDNKNGAVGMRGIYQWVDKKYKARIVNVGKRLLYDVVVPEPAAFLVESLKRSAQPENFQLVRPPQPHLLPTQLNAGNYAHWAALYGVTGAVSPPPEEFLVTVAHVDAQKVDQTISAYGRTFNADVFQAFTIQIPEGYKAVSGYIQRTNVRFEGVLEVVMEVFIGDRYFFSFNVNSYLNEFFSMNDEAGALPVTLASSSKLLQFNYAIGITCRRMDKALEQWQLKTHAAIIAGYQRQRAEYLDQLGRYQNAVRQQFAAAGKLVHDGAVERDELKRCFIHLLMSEHFPNVFVPTPNPQSLPPDPVQVKTWGAIVAFFERAFEWENLMYIYYPYFWGRMARWGELVLTQDADPQFEAFLRAGAARIVVPARPGFEAALAHYHETGGVWMGEEIPDMFSKQYVSIIAEIKARNALPDEEVCLAEWDVRLPTTLVMLKDQATLPEWDPERECIVAPVV